MGMKRILLIVALMLGHGRLGLDGLGAATVMAEAREEGKGGEFENGLSSNAIASDDLHQELEQAKEAARKCLSLVKPIKEGAKEMEKQLRECKESVKRCAEKNEQVDKSMQSSMKASSEEIEQLKAKLEEAQQRVKVLEAEVRDIHSSGDEMDKLREELRDSKVQAETALAKAARTDALIRENKELRENNTALIKIGKMLRSQAKQFKKDAEGATKLLELERGVSSRLQELLESKDVQLAMGKLEVQEKQQDLVDNLQQKIKELTQELHLRKENDFDKDLDAQAENRHLRERVLALSEEKYLTQEQMDKLWNEKNETEMELGRVNERLLKMEGKERDLEDCLKDTEKYVNEISAMSEQIESLETERDQAKDEVDDLSKREAQAKAHEKKLRRYYEEYKRKVDDPALFDYVVKKAEWLQHPKLEGVDDAYRKTLKLIAPQLNSTQLALIEMQALVKSSSDGLSVLIGKPEYTPLVSGVLTYGILMIPFFLTVCLLVRLKSAVSLGKAAMWMSLYNVLFCAVLICVGYALQEDGMAALRNHNEELYEFLQILVAIAHSLYVILICFHSLKQVTFEDRCQVTLRHLLQVSIPFGVGIHYYSVVWLPAMKDMGPSITTYHWILYCACFSLEFLFVTWCSMKGNGSKNAKASSYTLPLLKHDTMGNPDSSMGKSHIHGHRVASARDEKSATIQFDIVEPETLVDDADTIAQAATTGLSMSEVQQRKLKSKKTKKKKKKRTTAIDPSIDDLGDPNNPDGHVSAVSSSRKHRDDDESEDLETQKVD